MRTFASRTIVAVALLALWPAFVSAQTSSIAGQVKDTSGAVLPGVTVEVASPALIEKVRSATTDGSGQYKITALRPGTYSITFTLPGFNVVKRDGIELTSDFTATVNGDMKVGAVEETVVVSAESPVVDTQSITTRTVMTREVLDAIPTGRNIQAVGIMIPGTTIAVGGGGALSRDVGGSGNLQQSPLQYRGSADTVQTVEGMRLNNLCANGAYSGVYWNDGSFQEISYVTGADSAEMGQGGVRVNMVPRDGGNAFHGVAIGNYAGSSFAADNCGARGVGQPCTRSELLGDTTFNPSNKLSNVSKSRRSGTSTRRSAGPLPGTRSGSTARTATGASTRPWPAATSTCLHRPSSMSPISAARASTMAISAASRGASRRSSAPRTRSRTTTTIRTRCADTGGSRRTSRPRRRPFRRRRPVSSR
jgi:hypothetical protein